jgi:O-antigen/teichoic acid export membrane protein
MKKINLIIVLLSISSSVFAYIGPGMGGGVIAAVLGVIGAVLLALFGILYYPIKRMLKNRKK